MLTPCLKLFRERYKNSIIITGIFQLFVFKHYTFNLHILKKIQLNFLGIAYHFKGNFIITAYKSFIRVYRDVKIIAKYVKTCPFRA